jgi:tetratricopeptide (TPR) repeat protein
MPSFEQQFQIALHHFNASDCERRRRLASNCLKESLGILVSCNCSAKLPDRLEEMFAAEDLFRRAIAGDDKDANAYLRLGRVLSHLGRWDDAIQVLESAVRMRPNFVDARRLLGDTL